MRQNKGLHASPDKAVNSTADQASRHASGTFKAAFMASVVWLMAFTSIAVIRQLAIDQPAKLAKDDARIAGDDEILKRYIKDHGADETITHVKALPVDCHQRAHKVGRLNYELNGKQAFTVINSECMSGYTHGVTEAYFLEHGTENLTASLELICQGQQNGFYSHQCFHGVGHGLMAYNDYDLPAALKDCDSLPPDETNRESCYSGVFMENVVGAITEDEAKNSPDKSQYHVTSWLSDDPLFPCNAVEDIYKNGCYIFQTSRMIQLFDNNFAEVAAACSSIEPEYRHTCFFSMGRDVSATLDKNYAKIEMSCNFASDNLLRQQCISGAAQDKFWHVSEQDDAIGLCQAIKDDESKSNCYRTIVSRGKEIIPTKDSSAAFCAKFEPKHRAICESDDAGN